MSNAVTEEEAKKRWCPFVRVSNGPDGSWNTMQDARSEQTYFCRASACMAWQWEFVETTESRNRRHGIGTYPSPEPIFESTGCGYCGLA